MPVERDERTYALAANMTKLKNNHEFRFGYSLNRLRMDHWQPELGYGPRGIFEFASNATALNGGAQTANLYNRYAAFLLGLASRGAESVQNELMTTREWQHGFYVRDRWQVSNKLTLDLGLRYEYYPLMTTADRGIEQVDLDTLTVRLGGVGGNPEDLGIKVSKTLFAPRLGGIYRIDDNTVFRTGYGITYNPLPFSRPLRGFYPLTISANLTTHEPVRLVMTLDQGVPDIVGPDVSSGNIPLPNSYAMRTPADDVSRGRIQSWNVALERRIAVRLSRGRRLRRHARAPAGSPISTSTPRRRRDAARTANRSSSVRTLRSRCCSGDRGPGRTTTPSRSLSTGRSRTACW